MRILHIVGTISPAAGGPTEVVRMLVRYAPPGYTAELVTLDDPAAEFLRDLDFPVHALGGTQKAWYSPKLIPWLKANRHRFDGVIVHGLWEFTGFAVRIAVGGRIPYLVFPHGMLDPYFKRRYPKKHLKKWLYWLPAEYWVLRGAKRVLFTTEIERNLAAQSFWLHRWRPMVVALGTEPPSQDTGRLIAAFHQRWPQMRGKRFLLFLGRIDPKKGCDLLLQAFAKIARQDPNLYLMLAGPSEKEYRLKLESENFSFASEMRVHWPGMLQGDAKWGALAACEAFVLTSHQENFGIAVVEALASGKPVLISDQINIAHDIAADGAGLVEPDTMEGATRLLERWQTMNPIDRSTMSQQALNTFAARYDMRHNTEAILNVFQQKESQ